MASKVRAAIIVLPPKVRFRWPICRFSASNVVSALSSWFEVGITYCGDGSEGCCIKLGFLLELPTRQNPHSRISILGYAESSCVEHPQCFLNPGFDATSIVAIIGQARLAERLATEYKLDEPVTAPFILPDACHAYPPQPISAPYAIRMRTLPIDLPWHRDVALGRLAI